MYIEIESEQRTVPQIMLRRRRSSNVIKKSEIRFFCQAQTLLKEMEERADEYQDILEQQVLLMIEDKELVLNEYIEKAYDTIIESKISQQEDWFKYAQDQLTELLYEQQNYLNQIKQDLKGSMAVAVKSRLTKLNHSDHLIDHLIEVLHAEIDDEARNLSVKKVDQDDGVVLTIENEDSIISINTASLIEELRVALDHS
ncbi:hypothetical protein L1D61_25460 [Vibrio mediterranei]|uniref:Uncharacterized protein n=1 Tax=Vibrio mediterranei TaxID=689 RepID=A0A3G4VJY3_9VIBR|nr:hypothetical protein [Vibrio mediterranei]AYV25080.1 hypothetical protein ECB94_27690 [Vibrio mediterranei]MCG9790503.1 hypothetical protein [Vibrio mediterranei]